MKTNGFTLKSFKLKVTNGTLRGYWMVPKLEGKTKFPTVILSHGIGSNQFISFTYGIPFARRGYQVLCYDFANSGSGLSGLDSTKMSLLSEKQDLLELIDYVKTLPSVDTDHLILSGCSQGGLVSSLAAAEREDDIERQILYYPAYSIPDLAREGHLMTAKYDPKNIPNKQHILFLKINKKYPEDAMTLDPYAQMCTYQKPVYIVHGTQDGIIDVNYSRKARQLFPNCKLDEINGDHGFIKRGAFAGAIRTIVYIEKEMNQ